jgi:hypothetical protein
LLNRTLQQVAELEVLHGKVGDSVAIQNRQERVESLVQNTFETTGLYDETSASTAWKALHKRQVSFHAPDDIANADRSTLSCEPQAAGSTAHRFDKTLSPKHMSDLHQVVPGDSKMISDLSDCDQLTLLCREVHQQPQRIVGLKI